MSDNFEKVDSHQHFWKLSRGDYDWLTNDIEELYKNFLPEDYRNAAADSGVVTTILVQATETLAETEFCLELARQNDSLVAGVVGWVNIKSTCAEADIRYLSKNALFKGIRPMLQNIDDIDWLLNSKLNPVFETLKELDLGFDALVRPQHLSIINELLNKHKGLKLVIDHAAKPRIAQGEIDSWANEIKKVASHSNAYCKVSGLLTEAKSGASLTDLKPYLDILLDNFGANRLMWGSDWPVLNLASDFQAWVEVCEQWMEDFTDSDKKKIWSSTSKNFYSL